jgi:hypothetical protein
VVPHVTVAIDHAGHGSVPRLLAPAAPRGLGGEHAADEIGEAVGALLAEPAFTRPARHPARAGQERGGRASWHDLAAVFLSLKAPPRRGTLLRSVDGPRRFCSFGPGPSRGAIAAMRAELGTPTVIGKLTARCAEAEPDTFPVAATAGAAPLVS